MNGRSELGVGRYPAAASRKPARGVGRYPRAETVSSRYKTVTAAVARRESMSSRATRRRKICSAQPKTGEFPPQMLPSANLETSLAHNQRLPSLNAAKRPRS